MTPSFLPIGDYLPHRGRMVLLDRVLEAAAGRIVCAVGVRGDSVFCRDGRVPAYVGIEYMAQTAGALVGWESREKGEPVKTGFLVSAREYVSSVDGFPAGAELAVEAREDWRDGDGIGVMSCVIFHPSATPVAQARLVLFQPENIEVYLTT
jgi:predicted hotdog family 3-hydroxylacyl-ACP dehydratase